MLDSSVPKKSHFASDKQFDYSQIVWKFVKYPNPKFQLGSTSNKVSLTHANTGKNSSA